MGEAFITRRGGAYNNFNLKNNYYSGDTSAKIKHILDYGDYEKDYTVACVKNLDFKKCDYICHFVSVNMTSESDTYVIKNGIITEEYHSDNSSTARIRPQLAKDAEGNDMILISRARYMTYRDIFQQDASIVIELT